MKLYYKKFKNHFSSILNNLINYPEEQKIEDKKERVKGEWEKTRVNLNN